MREKLRTLNYRAWNWYGRRVLKIPFVLRYSPPPHDKTMAVTFSWSLEYVQHIKDMFDTEKKEQT